MTLDPIAFAASVGIAAAITGFAFVAQLWSEALGASEVSDETEGDWPAVPSEFHFTHVNDEWQHDHE